jgi:hypothetical protein
MKTQKTELANHRGKRIKSSLESDKWHGVRPSRMAFAQTRFNAKERTKFSESLCSFFLSKNKSLTA